MSSPAHPVANDAASYSTFASLHLGRAAQTVVGRLIRFGDSRNINKNGEIMGITILLLDEMVHDFKHSIEAKISQLGHVKVHTPTLTHILERAFLAVLSNEKASREILNISGEKCVTIDGLARACAKAGRFPEPEIVHYNPKEFDFGKKKAFPFRDQHYFAPMLKAKHVLGWKPELDLVEGSTDSYNLDFSRGTFRKEADFTTDDMILSKKPFLPS
ncbi:hypothetical protein Bca4012_065368 [Brassica carinata]